MESSWRYTTSTSTWLDFDFLPPIADISPALQWHLEYSGTIVAYKDMTQESSNSPNPLPERCGLQRVWAKMKITESLELCGVKLTFGMKEWLVGGERRERMRERECYFQKMTWMPEYKKWNWNGTPNSLPSWDLCSCSCHPEDPFFCRDYLEDWGT